jgi:hypothetical protein
VDDRDDERRGEDERAETKRIRHRDAHLMRASINIH